MKRKTSILFAFIVIFSIFLVVASGCGNQDGQPPKDSGQSQQQNEQSKETIKIGALFALTGPAASLGIPAHDTVIMLEEQINISGGINGHPVKVISYDTETDGTKALLAAKKLIEEDGVQVVIGPSSSGESLALVPYFEAEGIPLISVASAAAIVEPVEERQWIFKTPHSDYLLFEAIVKYFNQHGLKRVGFISEATGFGDSGKIELEQIAPKAGIEVIAWERFDSGDRDMTAQLTKIRRGNPDAIIVWSIPPAASIVQQNIHDMGFEIPVIQSHGIGNMTFIEVAGEAAEGILFPAARLIVASDVPDTDPQKETLMQYSKDYLDKYGEAPNSFGANAWDAFMLAIEAYKDGASTSQEIRDYLEGKKNFVGINGVFNFSPKDHNGLDSSSLAWIEVKNGGWTLHQLVE